MKYLLDTNACIGWLRLNQSNLVARIKRENFTDLAICSVVVGELIYGVERGAASQKKREISFEYSKNVTTRNRVKKEVTST